MAWTCKFLIEAFTVSTDLLQITYSLIGIVVNEYYKLIDNVICLHLLSRLSVKTNLDNRVPVHTEIEFLEEAPLQQYSR